MTKSNIFRKLDFQSSLKKEKILDAPWTTADIVVKNFQCMNYSLEIHQNKQALLAKAQKNVHLCFND